MLIFSNLWDIHTVLYVFEFQIDSRCMRPRGVLYFPDLTVNSRCPYVHTCITGESGLEEVVCKKKTEVKKPVRLSFKPGLIWFIREISGGIPPPKSRSFLQNLGISPAKIWIHQTISQEFSYLVPFRTCYIRIQQEFIFLSLKVCGEERKDSPKLDWALRPFFTSTVKSISLPQIGRHNFSFNG